MVETATTGDRKLLSGRSREPAEKRVAAQAVPADSKP